MSTSTTSPSGVSGMSPRRSCSTLSAFPLAPRARRDPTVAAANERQRAALLAAVAPGTKDWPDVDRAIAAAMFDVLWSPVSFERLAMDWELDAADAIAGITWVIGLVEDAIRHGRHPSDGSDVR